ncbi:uncharacterized protein LOC135142575 [Zophobas morio]|uniref:uncharacterized protein LOC135142575 n=1 Tax=Zophobas morio TaxID=2755281 RepID=UPI0030839DC0
MFEDSTQSETWLHEGVANSELFPMGYNVFRCDRLTSRGGGVLIAIKDKYSACCVISKSPIPEIELVAVQISSGLQSFVIASLYIPPGLVHNIYDRLLEYLEATIAFTHPVLITGDFSIPEFVDCLNGMGMSYLFNIFKHFLSLNSLTQWNTILNHNARLLDLVVSTKDVITNISKEEFPLVREDLHHPCLSINITVKLVESSYFRNNPNSFYFNFKKADLVGLYSSISTFEWSKIEEIKQVDTACNYFYDVLFDLFSQFVPLSSGHSKRHNYPIWFTKSIIDAIKQRRYHWNKYKKTGIINHLDKHKELRRKIKYDIRNAYSSFLKNAEHSIKDNPKNFWTFVNNKKNQSRIPGNMISDGNTFTSSQDIVDAFGHLFAGVFSSSDNHICGQYCDNIRCEFCDKKCCPSLQLKSSCESSSVLHPFKINESDVVKAVKRIKSNNIAGPDRVPAFIVSDCISCFVVPLLHIFNLIIKTSVYPSSWLISRVCPVFKNGDKFDINNYRPIAILSNFAKLFESILSNVIYAHVVNFISNDQHGFIKGKSTSTNLFEFTQLVSQALDNRLQVDVIYTDLTKAFDKVHHCILLKKLQRFGFCASLVSLLKAMVMNRFQYVEYNGYKSREFSCNSGVAQGSNLGPLLFIIFFNDISEYINSKFFVYADDLKLIKFINSSSDCYDLQDSIDSFLVLFLSKLGAIFLVVVQTYQFLARFEVDYFVQDGPSYFIGLYILTCLLAQPLVTDTVESIAESVEQNNSQSIIKSIPKRAKISAFYSFIYVVWTTMTSVLAAISIMIPTKADDNFFFVFKLADMCLAIPLTYVGATITCFNLLYSLQVVNLEVQRCLQQIKKTNATIAANQKEITRNLKRLLNSFSSSEIVWEAAKRAQFIIFPLKIVGSALMMSIVVFTFG